VSVSMIIRSTSSMKTIVAYRYNPEQKGFEELSDMKTGDSRRP